MFRSTDPFIILDSGSGKHSEIFSRSARSEVSESFEVGQERNLWLKSLISLARVKMLLLILFLGFVFLFGRLIVRNIFLWTKCFQSLRKKIS